MKVDTSGLHASDLLHLLRRDYALDLHSLAFLPKGEEAYHFVGMEASGRRWFLKAQDMARASYLEIGLQVAMALEKECGLNAVLSPIQTRVGDLSVAMGRFRLAVFPFLDGASGQEVRLTDDELAGAARLVAAVHGCTDRLSTLPVPSADYSPDWVSSRISRSLQAVGDLRSGMGGYRGRVRDLLLAEQRELLAELETGRSLWEQACALTTDPVLAHGDPNYANFVRDAGGHVYLVDWSSPVLGPREGDLIAFTEDRFELALRSYLDAAGPVRLHTPIFAYYAHRWVASEIADYSTRILFTNTDPAEDEHFWEELMPYLPIPHAQLAAGTAAIDAVLHRVQ